MRKFSKQAGVSMIEYALIAALVAVVSALALTNLGTTISGKFTAINTAIAAAK